jgi:Zn-dependent M28 family amino/carboxypeptidase
MSKGKYLTIIGDYLYFVNTDMVTSTIFGDGIYRAKLDGSGWLSDSLTLLIGATKVVDGANDNLSGCYIGMAILKALHDEGIEFENTEIGVVCTGSEEAGLRGAKAWAAAHADEMKDVPTFVFSYDTIAQNEQLMVNYRDLNATVKTDKEVGDLFFESCEELGIPCKKGVVPPLGGATDSAAFAQAGMRSTGITALNHALPDFYHTRLDTPEALNPSCLADCFAASVLALEKFDKGAKQ